MENHPFINYTLYFDKKLQKCQEKANSHMYNNVVF